MTYRYSDDTLDFSTDGATAGKLRTDGRSPVTVTADGAGDTGDFALEYSPNGSDWYQFKAYAGTGDVDETVTLVARAVRLASTAAGSGGATVHLAAGGE